MQSSLLWAALFAAICLPIAAQTVSLQVGWDCAEWAKYRMAGNALALEQFVVGELNGLAMGTGLDIWSIPTPIEPDQVYYWMDMYCQDEPLAYVTAGVAHLVVERFGPEWYNLRPEPAN